MRTRQLERLAIWDGLRSSARMTTVIVACQM
jgi:hypothetical protein